MSRDTAPRRRTVLGGLALVLLTAVAIVAVQLTEPEPEREAAVKRTAMLVETTPAQAGDWTPRLSALGTVQPAEEVRLQPRVSGQVVALAADFVPGAVVDAGAVLVEVDPADARNALAQAESALALAEAELELEQGRQAVARAERAQIRTAISDAQERLVLREPQLRAAEATVADARARVAQARLELERTKVRAPSRALVLSRDVGVGSLVGPSSSLGRLVRADQFWVELSLPARLLAHLPEGAAARVRDTTAWSGDRWRDAVLTGVIREVDAQTRMGRLVLTVDDPLGLDVDLPALTAGAFVEAELDARPLTGVVRIPRELLRKDGVVWVMEEGVLRLRPVEVILQDATHAYIGEGLAPGAQVVVTDLSTVADGAPLRTAADSPAADSPAADSPAADSPAADSPAERAAP